MEFTGDIKGIRTSYLNELCQLCESKIPRSELISRELLDYIVKLTEIYHREISIYITRSGLIAGVSFGRHDSVTLPPLKGRISPQQMRCIHTHPNGNGILSHLDLTALEQLSLESMTAVGVRDGKVTSMQCAVYGGENHPFITVELTYTDLFSFDYGQFRQDALHWKGKGKEKKAQETLEMFGVEKGILIALLDEDESDLKSIETLNELKELSRTAGVQVVGAVTQPRRYQDQSSYLGKGKLKDLSHLIQSTKANVVICDDELKPNQQRVLEEHTGIKVIDRTALILDIFAQRARSREGKLQVELAQLKYLLPRLMGQGTSLSRLGGGIGTRGPGETKLETDRRHIRQKIMYLEQQLKMVRQDRETQRKQRVKSGLPLVSLVGYTNAGKTTFMQKALEANGSKASIPHGEDMLFATLDPIIRKVSIGYGEEILLSDTVGFIQKLPHQLLNAFLATLEEVLNADILIHVLDASHPQAVERAHVVQQVIHQLNASDKPMITLLNKIDRVETQAEINRLAHLFPHPVPISLKENPNLTPVWHKIRSLLN